LGDRETFVIEYFPDFTGDKTKACWFPNETIAEEWQDFVQGISNANIDFADQTLPENIILHQNDPNPFNPSTKIKYEIKGSKHVSIKIYNLSGQYIETLLDELQTTGKHEITWKPKGIPGGIYFYQLKAGGFSEIKKLILER